MRAKNLTIRPVFLCGGTGARLWPVSTEDCPKQFVSLFGGKSLLQLAYERVGYIRERLENVSAPILVANERHRFVLTRHLEDFSEDQRKIFLEPSGRNTAPALTLAALEATLDDSDCVLIVMPSDQMVRDPKRFAAVIEAAVFRALEGEIIAFGVNPTRPATGYGYLSVSSNSSCEADSADFMIVESFIEKPDKSTAQSFLDTGNVYWNSGIYVCRASVWLNALRYS
jgi:mannose-1-phosphate guanylyltransferase/mannose-6-phosphate isomerase